MPRIPTFAITLAAVALSVSMLEGQTTKPEKPDTTKPLNVTAALAYLNSSGNSEVTSLTINEKIEWKRPRYLRSARAAAEPQ